jgi:hypothetical protein
MISCATHAEKESTAFCLRCERPLCNLCGKTFAGKTYCETCAADLERKAEERYQAGGDSAAFARPVAPAPLSPAAPVPYGRSLLFAVLGGAGGALIWFAVVTATDMKLGIVAIGVGILVGKGAVLGAGGRGGQGLALLAVVVALVAMGAGEYLMMNHAVLKYMAEHQIAAPASGFIGFGLFAKVYGEGFGFMDLVFYGIGAHQAWRQPAAAPA